jgi:hypothetical protein
MMVHRRMGDPRFGPQQTVRWLQWLAAALRRHNVSVFYLEWMQPDWLPTRMQQRLVTIGVAVAVGLVAGLLATVALLAVSADLIGTAVIFGAIVGSVACLAAYGPKIRPAEHLRWSFQSMRAALRRWVPRSLFVGAMLGAGIWVLSGRPSLNIFPAELPPGFIQFVSFASYLLEGAGYAALVGVLVGLLGGVTPHLTAEPVLPDHGVRRSRRNAVTAGAAVALGSQSLVMLLLPFPLLVEVVLGFLAALFFGIPVALLMGGRAYLQSMALRALLVRNGYAPRRYVKFLDEAATRHLLRKVGGGYIFVHRLLLDYLADQWPEEPAQVRVTRPWLDQAARTMRVTRAAGRALLARRHQRIGAVVVEDALLAIGLAATAVLTLPSMAILVNRNGGPVAVLLQLAQTLPLAWRRQRPLVVLSLTLGASVLARILGYVSFGGHLFALYTVAAYCRPKVSLLALAVAFAVHLRRPTTDPPPIEVLLGGPGAFILSVVPYISVWAAGVIIRNRRRRRGQRVPPRAPGKARVEHAR